MRHPEKQKPSVLHVYKDFYPPVPGGMEKCVHWMARECRDEFHVRVLVGSRSRRLEDDIIDGIRVVRVPEWGRAFSSPLAPAFVPWLKRLDSDILHFHMPNPMGELACLLARPSGRITATYHSDIVRQKISGLFYRPFQKRFLDRALSIMPTTARYVETSDTLRPYSEKCSPLPLGIPLENMEATPESEAFSAKIQQQFPDDFRIVFVGVLRYYKGLSFLIQALAQLPQKVRLVLGGDGPERQSLQRLAKELNVTARVHFLGRLEDGEVTGLLRAGHVFCLPAHLRSEAFGLCQIEAMACGLPVVSTNLPTGVPEVNAHGESGLVVEPANPEALSRALKELMERPEWRKELGEKAQQRAREKYSAQKMGEALKAHYRRLLTLAPPCAKEKSRRTRQEN